MNIAVGGNPQQSIRRALGVLKDSTAVGLVKVNSDYKDLDIAIVKATNHFELLPKEKHVRTIFQAISASRPRADVTYCIHNLVKRLARTKNWAVALKTLVVIHRALRETDKSFREELLNYRRTRAQMLNLSHFKDDSSTTAWDYSAWVRTYALFLEERLECSQILKYDIESEPTRITELGTSDLLEQLPALQILLFRLVGCQPEGAALHNQMIRFVVSMVAQESTKVYAAIRTGTINLVDKFFDMQRQDAIRALDIYRKAVLQAGSLKDFYKTCRSLDLGRIQDFKEVEQPPKSFLGAMEEYIKCAPRLNMLENGREIIAIEYKNNKEPKPPVATSLTSHQVILPATQSAKTTVQPSRTTSVADLLCLDERTHDSTAHEAEETNPLAIVLVSNEAPIDNGCASSNQTNAMEDWELALVTALSSNQSSLPNTKLADGLNNKLMLDNIYENSVAQEPTDTEEFSFPIISDEAAPANPFEIVPYSDDPFFVPRDKMPSSNIVPFGTETVPRNNVPFGTETGRENSFFVPSSGERVPSNGVPLRTETGSEKDYAVLLQGQEISRDIAKNPFGNPFM